jgi:hypothetical protein
LNAPPVKAILLWGCLILLFFTGLVDRGKVNVDLSADFDTIDHHILLERLETQIGLHGQVLAWFDLICRKDISLSL